MRIARNFLPSRNSQKLKTIHPSDDAFCTKRQQDRNIINKIIVIKDINETSFKSAAAVPKVSQNVV